MGVDNRASLDGIGREFWIGRVQQPEATRPPATPGVDVRARIEQDVQHLPATDIDDGRRIERTDCLVDQRLELRMTIQDRADSVGVIGCKRGLHLVNKLDWFWFKRVHVLSTSEIQRLSVMTSEFARTIGATVAYSVERSSAVRNSTHPTPQSDLRQERLDGLKLNGRSTLAARGARAGAGRDGREIAAVIHRSRVSSINAEAHVRVKRHPKRRNESVRRRRSVPSSADLLRRYCSARPQQVREFLRVAAFCLPFVLGPGELDLSNLAVSFALASWLRRSAS